MSRHINYDLLNKNELLYEVAARLEEPASTLFKLKKQILSLISTTSESILDSPFSVEDDLNQSEVSLDYLKTKFTSLEAGNSKFLKKIISITNHLFYRLERIDIDVATNFSEKFSELKERFSLFELCLKPFLETEENAEGSQTCTDQENLHQSPEPNALPIPSSTPFPQPSSLQNVTVVQSGNLFNDIRKFSYNGKTCPRSFLSRLEEFRITRNLPKSKLIEYGFELFSGDALHWFRFQKNRSPNITWDELSALLVENFLTSDYDEKLIQAIRDRTQGLDESLIIYISIMSSMFSRLTTKLSEDDQLKILLKNIRPSYSLFVNPKEVNSIDSLLSAGRLYERFLDKDKNFKEPNIGSTTFSEFNYKPWNPVPSSSNSNRPAPPNKVNALNDTPAKTCTYYCVRCRTSGHSLRNCSQPRFLICFKCGLKGYITRDCPKCNNLPSTSNNQKN